MLIGTTSQWGEMSSEPWVAFPVPESLPVPDSGGVKTFDDSVSVDGVSFDKAKRRSVSDHKVSMAMG